MSNLKTEKRTRRHQRIRAKISGTSDCPRLAVSRSNKNFIVQIIDDQKKETLAYVWTRNLSGKTLRDKVIEAGKKITEQAKAKKIEKVVFDRGGFIYTGNIKNLAESAREAGLKF